MLVFNNVYYPNGHWGTAVVSLFSTPTETIILVTGIRAGGAILDGTVSAVGDTVTLLDDDSQSTTLEATDLDDPNRIVFLEQGTKTFLVFSATGLSVGNQFSFTEFTLGDYLVPCFAAGTRILTRRGEVAVEELAVGDEVVAMLGRLVPVTWIGRRSIDCARARHPAATWPIRVMADAFGPAQPYRDLFLSPDHAVHVDGVLVPVRYLVNGTSIAPDPRDAVTWFHVELARHDVLLAEGLGCESYLDTGNRGDFEGDGRDAAATEAQARAVWASAACAPLHTHGALVDAIRDRLAARAGEPGLPPAPGPAPAAARNRVAADALFVPN